MPNKPLAETPPEATDPVTLIYFHNHFIQLNNWLNSLKWKHPDSKKEFEDVQELLDTAQNVIKSIHDKENK